MSQAKIKYSISQLNPNKLAKAMDLVWAVFSEFVLPDYEPVGIEEFKKFIDCGIMAAKLKSGEQTMWVCCDGQEIVGVISCGPKNHISLLFVDKNHHRKGIAGRLINKAVVHYKNIGYNEIDVNASAYGCLIYQKLGFKITASEKTVNGIRFIPMLLKFKA